jgi:hypothetical protein
LAAASAAAALSHGADALIWRSIDADRTWLVGYEREETNKTVGSRLIDEPLWLLDVRGDVRYKANMPIWARRSFDRGDDLVVDSAWRVWFQWYRSILPNSIGRRPSTYFDGHDEEIATQPNKFWTRDLGQVVTEIAALVGDSPRRRVTIAQFIVEYLGRRQQPVQNAELLEAFRREQYSVIPKTVRGELSRLASHGRIKRVSPGLYQAIDDVVPSELPDKLAAKGPELVSQGSGPKFSTVNGVVTTEPIFPAPEESTDDIQADLLERLKRKISLFKKVGGNFAGQYPVLADAIDDYLAVIWDVSLNALDIGKLWMAGVGLIAQARAFAALDPTRQVTQPLEPQLQGLLGECARLHGALVMGFEEGRQLAERSQVPLLTGAELAVLFEHERAIVRWLLTSGEFGLSDQARSVFELIDRTMVAAAENAEGLAMVGYPALRNLLVLSGHAARYIEIVAGRISLLGIPVHLAILGLAAFLTQNASDIIGVANTVPELHVYFEWLFERLEIRYQSESRRKPKK